MPSSLDEPPDAIDQLRLHQANPETWPLTADVIEDAIEHADKLRNELAGCHEREDALLEAADSCRTRALIEVFILLSEMCPALAIAVQESISAARARRL